MTGCPCHSEHGLISNAIEHVFNLVHHHQSNSEQEEIFLIKCAYLESKILVFFLSMNINLFSL
jgi:hypothetical protein